MGFSIFYVQEECFFKSLVSYIYVLCIILSWNMKGLIIILLIGQGIVTWGQKRYDDKNLPFQVIHSESVENSKGQEIKELDIIAIDEVLTIRQNGFLSMMHYFGFPLEISGDTVIKVKDIHTQFDLLNKRKKKAKYSYLTRPNIEYLFLTDGKLGRKNKLSNTGACHDCNFGLEIIYPPQYKTSEVFVKGDLCLTWQPTSSKNYEIALTNVFDEKVKTYTSTTNDLKIEENEIKLLMDKEKVLLFQIKDLETNMTSLQSILREFPSDLVEFPYSCTPEKATYALIAGFYLEMSRLDNNKEAGKYFKLATELSNREFYKTMLDNFIKRRQ